MYYQEKLVDGVLMCRNRPDGEWIPYPKDKLGNYIVTLQKALADATVKYEDLLSYVETKTPGVTRHEMAVRHIQDGERKKGCYLASATKEGLG